MRFFNKLKSVMLIAASLCCFSSVFAETKTVYSWESPDGTPIETGGTMVYTNGDGERLNYSNAGNYTICLNGKYANMGDAPSSNAGYMLLTLDEALQEGDVISMTGYRNKDANGKNATVYFLFDNGAEWKDSKSWVNICSNDSIEDFDADGHTPNTNTWTITAAEAGSKVIKLSRNSANTNIFFTKMTITREEVAAEVTPTLSNVSVVYESVASFADADTLRFTFTVDCADDATVYVGGTQADMACWAFVGYGMNGQMYMPGNIYPEGLSSEQPLLAVTKGTHTVAVPVGKSMDAYGMYTFDRVSSLGATWGITLYNEEMIMLQDAIEGTIDVPAAPAALELLDVQAAWVEAAGTDADTVVLTGTIKVNDPSISADSTFYITPYSGGDNAWLSAVTGVTADGKKSYYWPAAPEVMVNSGVTVKAGDIVVKIIVPKTMEEYGNTYYRSAAEDELVVALATMKMGVNMWGEEALTSDKMIPATPVTVSVTEYTAPFATLSDVTVAFETVASFTDADTLRFNFTVDCVDPDTTLYIAGACEGTWAGVYYGSPMMGMFPGEIYPEGVNMEQPFFAVKKGTYSVAVPVVKVYDYMNMGMYIMDRMANPETEWGINLVTAVDAYTWDSIFATASGTIEVTATPSPLELADVQATWVDVAGTDADTVVVTGTVKVYDPAISADSTFYIIPYSGGDNAWLGTLVGTDADGKQSFYWPAAPENMVNDGVAVQAGEVVVKIIVPKTMEEYDKLYFRNAAEDELVLALATMKYAENWMGEVVLQSDKMIPAAPVTVSVPAYVPAEEKPAEEIAWLAVGTIDFEDEATYAEGWTLGGGVTQFWNTREDGTHFMNVKENMKGDRDNKYTLTNAKYLAADQWRLDFDWAAYSSNSNNSSLIVYGDNGVDTIFYTTNASWSAETKVLSSEGVELVTLATEGQDKNTRGNDCAVQTWYHYSLIGTADGVTLTITAADGSEVLAATKVSEFAHAIGFNLRLGKSLAQMAMDEITMYIGGKKVVSQLGIIDFEDEATYTDGWTLGSKTTAFWGTRTSGTHFMNLKNTGSGNDDNTFEITNSKFLAAEEWTLAFDFAGYNSNSKKPYLKVSSDLADTLMIVSFPATWSAPVDVQDGAGNILGTVNCDAMVKATRELDIAVTVWHHVLLEGTTEGIFMTVTAEDGTEEIARVKIAEAGAHPTKFNLHQGNALSQWAIDDITMGAPAVATWGDVAYIDFENEATYADGWTLGGGVTQFWNTREDGTHFMNVKENMKGDRDNKYTITNSALAKADEWQMQFDWAAYSSNSNNSSLIIYGDNGVDTIFYTTNASWSAETKVLSSEGVELVTLATEGQDKNTRGNDCSVQTWYHFTLVGNADGVTLAIAAADGSEVLAATKVSEFAHPTGINLRLGKSLAQMAMDEIRISVLSAGEIIDAPKFTVEGKATTSNLITLTAADETVITYTVNGGDTLTYTEPFRIFTTSEIVAWAAKGDNVSEPGKRTIEAGIIAAPTATITAVNNETRTITLATATEGATISYLAGSLTEEKAIDLTQEMFFEWDSASEPTTSKNGYGALELNASTGLPYGDSNVSWVKYADLSSYKKLVVTVSEGAPRFCFNRLTEQGQDTPDGVGSEMIDIPGKAWGTERYQTVEGNVYTIDLAKIVADQGYAHLHCIKGANWANVTVTSLQVVGDVEKEKLTYTEPLVISDTTTVWAVATLNDEYVPEHVFSSETIETTLAAGTVLQLAAPTFAKAVMDSATTADYAKENLAAIILKADQSSVLCTPTASISYEYFALNAETGRVSEVADQSGAYTDTLKALPLGLLKATASAEGYAPAESHMWLKAPADLQEVWAVNFDSLAGYGWTGNPVISAAAFKVEDKDLGTITINNGELAHDTLIHENFGLQTGTSWLMRFQANGKVDQTGLYNYNSGGRAVGLANLKKNQVVKVSVSDASVMALKNDILVLDAAQTSGNDLVYRVTADGNSGWEMTRYHYIHSIGVYDDPTLTAIPEIGVSKVDGVNRYVGITSRTLGADIYYAIGTEEYADITEMVVDTTLLNDTIGGIAPEFKYDTTYVKTGTDTTIVYGEYALYTEPLHITATTHIKAYATYQDVDSEPTTATIETGTTVKIAKPVITYVGTAEGGKQFTITVDNSEVLSTPETPIYYTLAGGEKTLYEGTLTVADGVYGWLTATAELEGYETSEAANRYVDARETYNEVYEALRATDKVMPTEVADVEFDNVAGLNLAQEAALVPTGRAYVHYTMHAGYNAIVVPFNMTSANLENGTVKITDASGKALVRGTDFTFHRIQATTDYTTIEAQLAAGELLHTGNLVGNTQSYLIQVADEYVGQDLIFVSTEKPTLGIQQNSFDALAAEGKFKVVNNRRFQSATATVPVFVVNELGTKMVRKDAGAVIPAFSFALIADSAFTHDNSEIRLLDSSFKFEYKDLAQDTIFLTTPDNMLQANEEKWARNGDENGGWKNFSNVTNKKGTIDPMTGEECSSTVFPGVMLKNNGPKTVYLYVTNVASFKAYVVSTGGSDRVATCTATDSEGNVITGTANTASYTSAVLEMNLDPAKCYELKFSADADVMLYGINFKSGGLGIEGINADLDSDGIIYDLTGRRVQKLVKGQMYIQNGVKFLVK